jgi:uncharacterized protein (DUF58 family)
MVRMNQKALAFILLLFIAALLIGGRFIYGLFIVGFFLILTSYMSGRSSYNNLVNLVWKSSDVAVTGDKITLNMDLYNSGSMPIPYLRVTASLPRKLAGEELKQKIYSLMPGADSTLSREFECRHKGIYNIGYVETEFGDVLGIFKWKKIFDEKIMLSVYPRVHILQHFDIPLKQQFGTVAVKHNAYEDYASTRDIRKYAVGDSFKKMHWKVTAHRGDFYVRNVELNASADLNIFLDLYDYGFDEETGFDLEEKAAECAVSIIRYALTHSMSVNFAAKGEKAVTLSAKRVDRFGQFLDAIGNLTAKGNLPIADLVRREARKLDWDATVVIITPCLDKTSTDTYLSLKASGIEFVVVYLCRDRDEANEYAEVLRQNDFRLFTIGLEDDIKQVLGGSYEK